MEHLECMKSELDLFKVQPIQASVLKTEEVVYNPLSSIETSKEIVFYVPGNGDTYLDLTSVYLRLLIRVEGKTTEGGVVNNLLHSLFRNCSVHLNNVCVSQSDNNYHYRAYIEKLLNYGSDAASTHLESSGWYMDSGKFDSLTAKDNIGLDTRKKIFEKNKVVELIGKVHSDMFNQPKYMVNNVDLKITFNMEKPEFYMLEATEDGHIKIMAATLYVNHVTINPNILLAHHNALQQRNAVYQYKRVEIKTYTLNPGNHSLNIDNIVMGQLPNLIIFTMVSNEAYTGDRKKNPFNFQHFNMQQFSLNINGIPTPIQPIEFDFRESNGIVSTRGYNTLFKGTGIHYFDKGHQITKKLFDNGAFLLAFDITPDHGYNDLCTNLIKQGSIRIEGRFSEPLAESVTCLMYMEFDSIIEIDKNRNVKRTL